MQYIPQALAANSSNMVTEGKSVINSSSCNKENIGKMLNVLNVASGNLCSLEKSGKTGEEITNANPIDTNVNDKSPKFTCYRLL